MAQGSDHPQRPEDVHKPTAGERGRQNLATFDRQVGEAIRSSAPKGPRIERGVAALGQRLHGWFTPNASLLQEAGLKDVPWTALLPHSPRLEQLTGNTQYQGSPAEKAWSSAAELEESIAPPLAGSPLTQPPLLCFGACGDSHEKARLHALIAIDHLASGAPERWWIERSSGSGKFDNAALESVVSAAKFADPKALREGTRPTRSVWMFSATAYQWSRYELLLDPQFDPPGYEAEETSNLAGVTSIATSVRLVAVRYRDEPQPPASP